MHASVDVETLVHELRVVSLPLNTRFRGVTEREIALIPGPFGWGEFSPFLEYEAPEATRWLGAAIEAAYVGWPDPVRDQVPVNATVPAVPASAVPQVLARFDGCGTAKIKVAERGQSLSDDLDRVAAVREALGPQAKIRVDANGGWLLAQAQEAIAALRRYDLEYAEQPCATVDELRDLRISLARSGIDVRIAADESIRKAQDPIAVARAHAADLVVVKVAPLGGVAAALEVVQACGLPAVVSSALDSSVGISAGVALAAALPHLGFACGLGTVNLFDADVTENRAVPHGGVLNPGQVEVDPLLLEQFSAGPERVEFWRERVRAAYAHLPTDSA
ncbi:o-succinylbenzoate synthase [Dermacoccaceae bacterium W4C1]